MKTRIRINYYILTGLSFLIIFLTYYNLSNVPNTNEVNFKFLIKNNSSNYIQNLNEKVILFWSGHYGDYTVESWGVEQNSLENCKYKCHFTVNRNLLEVSHALIFHSDYYLNTQNRMPSKRSPNQIYIMYWHESPQYTFLPLWRWNDFFNWTVTYRTDSDIYNPYGSFEKLSNEDLGQIDKKPSLDSIRGKKPIVWLVSSCKSHSHRENFVTELRKYIPVDIYGRCGTKCENDKKCWEEIGSKYLFYLSLENSICKDYITEKFYRPYKHNMVPITNALNVEKIAPEGSYIQLQNFTSPKELASHLKYLQNNPEEYLKYFKWKDEFKVNDFFSKELCNLCTKVSQFDFNDLKKRKSYSDLHLWWFGSEKYNNISCSSNFGIYDKIQAFLGYSHWFGF